MQPEVTHPKVTQPKVAQSKVTQTKARHPKVTEARVTQPRVTLPKVTQLKCDGIVALQDILQSCLQLHAESITTAEYLRLRKNILTYTKNFGDTIYYGSFFSGGEVIAEVHKAGPEPQAL